MPGHDVRLFSLLAHGTQIEIKQGEGSINGCWTINGEKAQFAQKGTHVAGILQTGKEPMHFDGGFAGNVLRLVKFYRLLCEVETVAEGVYKLRLDGPLSLFLSTQKYGLQLALFLPAILLCKDFDLQARSDAYDVGADEYFASGATRVPLTKADVGPAAP